MKAIHWLASFSVGIAALTASAFATTPEAWSSDLNKALEKAKSENKSVLIEFASSDSCPPCIVMRNNVFSKKEFVTKASEKFVLVEIDFPNSNPELSKKNDPIAEKYNIEGFPTIVLLDSSGKEFTRFFAFPELFPNTESFLKQLDASLERKSLD